MMCVRLSSFLVLCQISFREEKPLASQVTAFGLRKRRAFGSTGPSGLPNRYAGGSSAAPSEPPSSYKGGVLPGDSGDTAHDTGPCRPSSYKGGITDYYSGSRADLERRAGAAMLAT